MAENVEGSFSFSVLDSNDNLYIVKGDSPISVLHFKKKQVYVLSLIHILLLNRNDIDFNERECIVFGKGSKERVVYFDARTKIHLQNYLENRICLLYTSSLQRKLCRQKRTSNHPVSSTSQWQRPLLKICKII